MPAAIASEEMQKWIERALAAQPDIGLERAVVNVVLEARSPFDPRARRKPRPWVVLGAVLFTAVAICFCYFSFAG
jgi:hypothetical protein